MSDKDNVIFNLELLRSTSDSKTLMRYIDQISDEINLLTMQFHTLSMSANHTTHFSTSDINMASFVMFMKQQEKFQKGNALFILLNVKYNDFAVKCAQMVDIYKFDIVIDKLISLYKMYLDVKDFMRNF